MVSENQSQVTYFGFDKFKSGAEARDALQLKAKKHINPLDPEDKSWSDARLRGEFDTLQLYIKGKPQVRIPRRLGDKPGEALEPFTEAYPKYGDGGAQQMYADKKIIKYNKVDIIPEE